MIINTVSVSMSSAGVDSEDMTFVSSRLFLRGRGRKDKGVKCLSCAWSVFLLAYTEMHWLKRCVPAALSPPCLKGGGKEEEEEEESKHRSNRECSCIYCRTDNYSAQIKCRFWADMSCGRTPSVARRVSWHSR